MDRPAIGRLGAFCAWGLLALASPSTAQVQSQGKPQESWDALYLGKTKVGHVHTKVERLADPTTKRELLRVQVDTRMTLKRQNDRTTQKIRYGTVETPDGQVLRLDIRIGTDAEELMRTSGDAIDGKMTLTLEGGGGRQQTTLDWGPQVRGPHAPELSLARAPMKSGETRSETMFIPGLNKLGTLTLSARAEESVELGGGVSRELLRVESTVADAAGKPIKEASQTLWVDPGGQVLKAYSDVFGGMTQYRTIESAAKAADGDVDLIAEQIVKIPQKIPNASRTRTIRYQVTLKDDDPATLFPADRRQSIRPGGAAGSVVLEVRTAGPNDGTPGPEDPGAEYLRPNPQVNSDDPRVVAHMKKAVAGAADPWAKAVAIQHWVAQNIRAKNFSTSFAPASQVAERLAGDCTEHSVLTAAMCRAAGIPARVAIGLVYAEHLGGFGYHMWNEVYVNRRWVAIDSAFDQSEVDAVHLKFNDSSLDGVSPFDSFLAVARAFKKLGLRPLEIR